MIRLALLLLGLSITAGIQAETIDFPVFTIELAGDWSYQIQASDSASAPGARRAGNIITLSPSSGIGKIQMLSFDASFKVEKTALRNLTNVNLAIQLEWNAWGNAEGYEYSYVENGMFFKQWWLTINNTVLFVTYSSSSESDELEAVNSMVDSIKIG